MELTERQKRNLLLLSCIFCGATGLIANDVASGGRVDRAWIIFAVGCFAGSLEILLRAQTNHPLAWPAETLKRAVIAVLLIGLFEVVLSLIVRATLDVTSETARIVVFGAALVLAIPAILIIRK